MRDVQAASARVRCVHLEAPPARHWYVLDDLVHALRGVDDGDGVARRGLPRGAVCHHAGSDAARAVAVYSGAAGDRRLRSILAIVRRVAVEVGKVSGSSSQSSDWGSAEFAFIYSLQASARS